MTASALACLLATIAWVLGCGSGGGTGDSSRAGGGLAPTDIAGSTLTFDSAPDVTYAFDDSSYVQSGPGGIGGVDGDMFSVDGSYTYNITRGDGATLTLRRGTVADVDGDTVVLPPTPQQIWTLTFASASDDERTGSATNTLTFETTGFTLTGDLPSGGGTPPRGPLPTDPAPESITDLTITIEAGLLVDQQVLDIISDTMFTVEAAAPGGSSQTVTGEYTYAKQDEDTAQFDYSYTTTSTDPDSSASATESFRTTLEFTSADGGDVTLDIVQTITSDSGAVTVNEFLTVGTFTISP